MGRKTTIYLMIILAVSAVAAVTMGFYDYTLVLHGDMPKFVFGTKKYEDGGTVEYTGFLYKIIDYNCTDGRDDVVLGTILMNYNSQSEKPKVPTNDALSNVKYNLIGTVKHITSDNGRMKIQILSNENETYVVEIISSSQIYKNSVKTVKTNIAVDNKVKCKVNITNNLVVPKQAMAQIINIVN